MFLRSTSCALTIAAVLLSGCGPTVYGNVPSGPASPVTPSGLTGNWEFDLEPAAGVNTAGLPFYKVIGALVGSASSSPVTGQLQAISSVPDTCTSSLMTLALTGTIDASSNVSLSAPLTGGALSIYGTYNSSLGDLFGVINATGSVCTLSSTAVQGYRLANLTGTWVGNLQNSSFPAAQTSTVTAVLNEPAAPNPDGTFTLTGTVTSTGACVGSYSFTTGVIAGASFDSESTAGMNQAPAFFAGTLPRLGFSAIPFTSVSFVTCASIYVGALTEQ